MMNSVRFQIERTNNDTISNQVLPQIQNVIRSCSGQVIKISWDVPSERPEINSEGPRSDKARNDVRKKQAHGRQFIDHLDDQIVYDMVTGENESSIPVPEFRTGRIPSRSLFNQSYEDVNLDRTIPAQERIAPAV